MTGVKKSRMKNGRSERIRTSGPRLPKTVLYQAELHSEALMAARKAAFLFSRAVQE